MITSATANLSTDGLWYFDTEGAFTSPFTVSLNPSSNVPIGHYHLAKIVYDWGDGERDIVFRTPVIDPNQTVVTHTYLSVEPTSTYVVGITAIELSTLSATHIYSLSVENVTRPSISGWDISLIQTKSMGPKGDTVVVFERTDTREVYPIIVSSIAVPGSTYTISTSCVDPSTWPLDSTYEPADTYVGGSSLPASAVYLFASDLGDSSSPLYNTLCDAMSSEIPDGYLIAGGSNYPDGNVGDLADNWNKFATPISNEIVWPAMGFVELAGSAISDSVVGSIFSYGDPWRYWATSTTLTSSPSAPWYALSAVYDDTQWELGNAPLGFNSGETTTTGPTAYDTTCSTTINVTCQFFRKNFHLTASDLAAPVSAVRIQFDIDDGAIIYVNGSQTFVHNMPNIVDTTTSAICEASGVYTFYLPTTSLSAGENTIAAQVHRSSVSSTNDLSFDLAADTVQVAPFRLPTTYGQPHLEYFDYLPNNRRYYNTVLPGDVELFVLNSSMISPSCSFFTEPDGIDTTSVQFNWLLTQTSQSTAKWKIAMFYHPFVDHIWHAPDMDWAFGNMGVDLIINGGTHTNEHLYYNGVHIVNASVGTQSPTPVYSIPYNPNRLWIDNTVGGIYSSPSYGKLEIQPTYMRVSFIRAATQTVLHQFTIV